MNGLWTIAGFLACVMVMGDPETDMRFGGGVLLVCLTVYLCWMTYEKEINNRGK